MGGRWYTFTCLSLTRFKFLPYFSLKRNQSLRQSLRSEIIYMTVLRQSVDPGSGPHMVSDGATTGPWGLVSILAHAGRSMAAVHTSSSVTQLLDFLCLLKLTLLLMCFSESIPMIKDPFIMGGREVHLTFFNCTYSPYPSSLFSFSGAYYLNY